MAVTVATRTSISEAVAEFAVGIDLSSAPDELFARATRAFIDTVGVALAAGQEPSFRVLAATLGSADGHSESTILPTHARTSAAQAALINGTAGHALDYDDVADEI